MFTKSRQHHLDLGRYRLDHVYKMLNSWGSQRSRLHIGVVTTPWSYITHTQREREVGSGVPPPEICFEIWSISMCVLILIFYAFGPDFSRFGHGFLLVKYEKE